MTQRLAITFRASPEVLAAVDARAAADFCKRGEAVALILESAVAQSAGVPVQPSKMADVKERGASVDLTMKEIRLAQLRKQILTVDSAVRVIEATFGEMRVEGHTLMNDIADEFSLDAEKLRRRFDEVMAGPFAVHPETYQQLADDFAKEPLPT